jgi:hypothetical protein
VSAEAGIPSCGGELSMIGNPAFQWLSPMLTVTESMKPPSMSSGY